MTHPHKETITDICTVILNNKFCTPDLKRRAENLLIKVTPGLQETNYDPAKKKLEEILRNFQYGPRQ